jgi:hypothetical protein
MDYPYGSSVKTSVSKASFVSITTANGGWFRTESLRCPKGKSLETRCNKHTWQLRLYQAEKSVVVEHSIELDHQIKFMDTKVLAITSGYVD